MPTSTDIKFDEFVLANKDHIDRASRLIHTRDIRNALVSLAYRQVRITEIYWHGEKQWHLGSFPTAIYDMIVDGHRMLAWNVSGTMVFTRIEWLFGPVAGFWVSKRRDSFCAMRSVAKGHHIEQEVNGDLGVPWVVAMDRMIPGFEKLRRKRYSGQFKHRAKLTMDPKQWTKMSAFIDTFTEGEWTAVLLYDFMDKGREVWIEVSFELKEDLAVVMGADSGRLF